MSPTRNGIANVEKMHYGGAAHELSSQIQIRTCTKRIHKGKLLILFMTEDGAGRSQESAYLGNTDLLNRHTRKILQRGQICKSADHQSTRSQKYLSESQSSDGSVAQSRSAIISIFLDPNSSSASASHLTARTVTIPDQLLS
ncbi:hypothetical protein MPTK1_4g11060 [Marchantia polymorpha subsp. ruderalis]|uniref:Uncharacterized protein n=2 Tax=Marchantia polymorpha TaxID=3197 RepID=A0AAF6B8P1_MARPO|nr:hypothetical protein MARPO_0011s0091 [Marchantia polymorpha]BBN08375.1 hypothetical protein Mp_4g11060 [Marchantia polymorpha subsp. ruderalis]|eukprot:PTQ46411.1 hypothetical protein MARPO_0011s0091 [Marchantia polymorpha]